MKGEIYRPRWQYAPPWAVSWPWLLFRVGRGGDEHCNPSVMVGTLLGLLVIFYKPGPLRTAADGPCDECLAADERDRAAGWTVYR
jgi:hypothetical protein